jgi:hypothetical protein
MLLYAPRRCNVIAQDQTLHVTSMTKAWIREADIEKLPSISVPLQVCVQLWNDAEAKYQIPGPYNWKGKRRKDLYLTKGLRYYRKSRDLPYCSRDVGSARTGM